MASRHVMRHLIFGALAALGAIVIGCRSPGYDSVRYDQMEQVIQGSRSNMLGMSFEDATRLLSLQGVPWDQGYDDYPCGEWRIYHLRGFYLALHLVGPPRNTDARVEVWSPRLKVDHLTDPKQRMSKHWAEVEESFKIRDKVAKELWGTNGTK